VSVQLALVGLFLIMVFLALGCSNLKANIQSELDANPKLSQKGLKATVLDVKEGFVTISVAGYGSRINKAIQKGTSLREIYDFESMDIEPLMEAEEILKKRPEVKGVTWVTQPQPTQ
jgi:hypothetical protein